MSAPKFKFLIVLAFFTMMTLPATHAQMKWRLVSKARLSVQPSPYSFSGDSTVYYYNYNDDRGSNKMADTLLFDSSWSYSPVDTPRNPGPPDGVVDYYVRSPQTHILKYDSADRIINSIINGVGYKNENIIVYNVDGTRKESKVYHSDTVFVQPYLTDHVKYNYDTAGRLIYESYELYEYPQVYKGYRYQKWHVYDTASRIVVDSAIYYSGGVITDKLMSEFDYSVSTEITEYTYWWKNTSGKFDSSGRKTSYLDSLGRVYLDTGYDYSFSKTGYVSRTTYAYSASGQLININYYYTFHHNEEFLEYNSYGYITKRVSTYYWGKPNATTTNYYYEHYWPADVNETQLKQADMQLYPNPASNMLNIKAKWKEAGEVKATITDMQGRVLMQWNEKASELYTKQLSIPQLQAGMYFLNLTCGGEGAVKQFVVN